jgi:hypothetical protein
MWRLCASMPLIDPKHQVLVIKQWQLSSDFHYLKHIAGEWLSLFFNFP